ncbi:MAG: hypothetical protein JSW07_01110, partial [bacterium]
PKLRKAVLAACKSERLDSLDIFDMDKLRTTVMNWLDSESGGGSLMMTLISINGFLVQKQ